MDRLQSEVTEVLGDKVSVNAEDLEKLQYTEQVSTHLTRRNIIIIQHCMNIFFVLCFVHEGTIGVPSNVPTSFWS